MFDFPYANLMLAAPKQALIPASVGFLYATFKHSNYFKFPVAPMPPRTWHVWTSHFWLLLCENNFFLCFCAYQVLISLATKEKITVHAMQEKSSGLRRVYLMDSIFLWSFAFRK